jgi:L-threonylcarbamoyladenylate synthase
LICNVSVESPSENCVTQVALDDLIAGARAGLLVSFPTDTVPALAVLPEKAELIFAAKQRSHDKPLILMGAKAEDLWPYIQGNEHELRMWQAVANQHWPGALTLVLPASNRLPPQMNPIDPTTVGIRVPNSAIAQTILSQTGPLATTSANFSGEPPLQTVTEIAAQFPAALTLASTELHSEISGLGVPSTVIKWTGCDWQILRQGAVQLNF